MSELPTALHSYDSISFYYDLMMQDRGTFVAYYASLIDPRDESILDIACGTGAITIELARQLRSIAEAKRPVVSGLDISAGMLEVARKLDPEIHWLQGDMRNLPEQCSSVNLATCCYNSLQHLDAKGLGKALRSIRKVLADNGRLAFDIYNPNLPYLRISRTDTLAREITDSDGTQLEIREDADFDDSSGVLKLSWRLMRTGVAGLPPLAQTSYEMWQHSPETVKAALAASGFEVIHCYGDLNRSPWCSSAKKQVVVCRAD